MKKTNKLTIYFFVPICILLSTFSVIAKTNYDYLGNPYQSKYKKGEMIYARNIWDMQLFDQKIYLGAGNSSNHGPAPNAGRVPLIYWDLSSKKFVKEYIIAEEQVDSFKLYGDDLYIPGHDATQKWILGNIYKKHFNSNSLANKNNRKWTKYRTLPKALHVYDLALYNNKIFTAIGLKGKGAVYVSEDNAKSWKSYAMGKGRVYSFFEVDDKLFATKTFNKKYPNKTSVYQWLNGKGFVNKKDLSLAKIFPNTRLKKTSAKLIKALKVNNKTYYLGAYKHNDHQSKPFGVYQAVNNYSGLKIKRIKLPNGYTPRDIIKNNDKVYLLVNKKSENNYMTKVLLIEKDSHLSEVLFFQYPAFSRSFETYIDNGKNCFYFGMGSDLKHSKNWQQDELKKETGDILKSCIY